MKMNKKGFTLIEMLVVIAIIAILVAIIIPTVSSATEKAKEATDAANIRSAVAEVTVQGLGDDEDHAKTIDMKQDNGFTTLGDGATICGIDATNACFKSATVEVKYTADTGVVTIGGVAINAEAADTNGG